MKIYQLNRITDKKGFIKTDEYSKERLNKEFTIYHCEIGFQGLFDYIGEYKTMFTTPIENIVEWENVLIVATENTVYYFMENGDTDNEQTN